VNELALFAGAGGGILGGKLLGWRTVCAVEFEQYARDVLVARQNDGCLEPFPIWDDVRTFDGKPWRGIVDVVSGGFPCQDISAAGKGAGIGGERSGLWRDMARIVGEVRPRFVWVENSPMLVGRGLGLVLLDLAAMGFSARWGVVGACDAGAPHKRERIWILADSERTERRPPSAEGCDDQGRQDADGLHGGREEMPSGIGTGRAMVADAVCQRGGAGLCQVEQEQDGNKPANGGSDVADSESKRLERQRSIPRQSEIAKSRNDGGTLSDANSERQQEQHAATLASESRQHHWCVDEGWREGWWLSEPDVGRVADGVAARVDRLKAIGNGQVPAVVRLAWNTLVTPP